MSRSSFPRSVPCSGAALCSTGSLGMVRRLLGSYCGTPTSRLHAPLASWLRGRASVLATGRSRAPKFLGDLRHTCHALRPRWNLLEQASGTSSLRLALSVLPSEPWASSASTTAKISGPNRAARLLAVYASCRSSPSAHARLASGWRPCLGRAGVQPARSLTWFLTRSAYMVSPPGRGCAWRTQRIWGVGAANYGAI